MTRNIYGDVTDEQGRPTDPGDSVVRNLAVLAQMRLEKLAEPHEIRPFLAGNDEVFCAKCGFSVEKGGHSESEIRWMLDLVAAHDDRKQP